MQVIERFKSAIRDVQDFPKPGIVFKDITPVFQDPQLVQEVLQVLVKVLSSKKIDAIAAVEARGFIFGALLAHELNCQFIPIRKAGKLPYHTRSKEYALEYGTAKIEMHDDAVKPGMRVLVHDDLLATGGTASAAAHLIEEAGGILEGFSFLINLSFLSGALNLQTTFGVKPYYLIEY